MVGNTNTWIDPKAQFNLSAQSIAAIETLVINEASGVVNYPEWYADPRQAIEVLKRLCEEMGFDFAEIEGCVERVDREAAVFVPGNESWL